MKIIRLIEKEMGFGAKIKYKQMQKGDVKETHASILETVNYTNYKPSKKIEDGIQEFVSWYKNLSINESFNGITILWFEDRWC